jgi:hypothetical protein
MTSALVISIKNAPNNGTMRNAKNNKISKQYHHHDLEYQDNQQWPQSMGQDKQLHTHQAH